MVIEHSVQLSSDNISLRMMGFQVNIFYQNTFITDRATFDTYRVFRIQENRQQETMPQVQVVEVFLAKKCQRHRCGYMGRISYLFIQIIGITPIAMPLILTQKCEACGSMFRFSKNMRSSSKGLVLSIKPYVFHHMCSVS